MSEQNHWYDLLDSVLFVCRVSQHKSIGFSPFRMLYHKDPILPFEYADRSDNSEPESQVFGAQQAKSLNEQSDSDGDPITNILNRMEAHKKYIFQGAEQNIKKAQTEQVKWYNLRNGAGTPFEVSQYVLQYNHHELLRNYKLHMRFLGPYKLISRCSTGNWYLLDCWGHCLSKSVPSNHLVWFYTKKSTKLKMVKFSD